MSIVAAPCPKPTCPAHAMTAQQRLDLALDCLLDRSSISRLAQEHLVSRKFVYQQRHKAQDALLHAFDPPAAGAAPSVLFHLPITKDWLRQFVLAATLVGHSSLRGVQEMLDCLLDWPVSLGWVHAVVKDAIDKARPINEQQDLSRVQFAALDEIFQNGRPVLAVIDVFSTYCCSLGLEDHRDGDTWGVRLLELRDRGFAPKASIADFGTGLRAGAKQALPGVPCRADVFHPLRDFLTLSSYLDNRAYDAMSFYEDLLRKQERHVRRRMWKDRSVAMKAVAAGKATQQAIVLADEVRLLLRWWGQEVMAVAGDDYPTRRMLHEWVVEELRQREEHSERIRPVRVMLQNNADELLAFALQLDASVAELAQRFEVSVQVVREALAVGQMDEARALRWQREAELWRQLGGKYAGLRAEVERVAGSVVRASSVIENYNSRLRNYFFLRKEVGGGYLELLRFFLNHRRLLRSEHAGRVGKSPAELLSGQAHAHWLTLLGYELFSQSQAA
jgi:predicted DNA-binding protein YlxM (UPF0122 family)